MVPSAAGNKYVFCLLDYDSSYIKPVLLTSRTKETLLTGFKIAVNFLTTAGLRPQLRRLDNEASQMLQDYMVDQKIDYQLTPAGLHRRNHAERAIRTFKAHFIAGLASVDPDFPLNQWDKLVEQAEITLNLLRPSRINPRLSAYEQIHGRFDFNRTPLAPPGIKVLAHVWPEDRTSWGVRAFEGFYIGPARHHYRCYKIYNKKTNNTRICDTIKWQPRGYRMPSASRESLILAAANDLAKLISSKKDTHLLPPEGSETRFELQPGMALEAQLRLKRVTLLQLIFSKLNRGMDAIRSLR